MSQNRKLTSEELDLLRAAGTHRCFTKNCRSQSARIETWGYLLADGTPMERLWLWCNACWRDREFKVKKKVKERSAKEQRWKAKT